MTDRARRPRARSADGERRASHRRLTSPVPWAKLRRMEDAPLDEGRDTPEKDVPLRYDTRLLGRILGDTVRAQEGGRIFDLVEHIRRTAVQFHRNADESVGRP